MKHVSSVVRLKVVNNPCVKHQRLMDARIRQCAMKVQDKLILAKLSAGDLIAQDVQYHPQDLVSLYNRKRESKTSKDTISDSINHGIAFAELVS